MRFPTPLCTARLKRRYKRFLADLVLEDGTEVVAHCPNPGAMTGMAEPGARCWLAPAAAGAKLDWSWKLVDVPEGLAVVDTGIANRVVAEALEARTVPGLAGYDRVRAEVPLGEASRIDFRLEGGAGPVWVEVKSVTLARGGWAEFPDSPTARGARHLEVLAAAVAQGARAAMVYLAVRDGAARIRVAGDIDPGYARAFAAAQAAGVRMIGLGCRVTPEGVWAGRALDMGG